MHSPYGRCNLAPQVSIIPGPPETALLQQAILLFEMREKHFANLHLRAPACRAVSQSAPGYTQRGRSL